MRLPAMLGRGGSTPRGWRASPWTRIGGVVGILLDMFHRRLGNSDEAADAARVEAGKALTMLSLERARHGLDAALELMAQQRLQNLSSVCA